MDVNYYSYSEKRSNERWNDPATFDNFIQSHVVVGKEVERADLIGELRIFDLELGSVANSHPLEDDPTVILEAIKEAAGAHYQDEREGFLNGIVFIELFENLSKEIIERAIVIYDLYNDVEVRRQVILDYLRSVQPVARDLKETPDAVLIIEYHGNETLPNELGVLLDKRAEELFQRYEERLSGIVRSSSD